MSPLREELVHPASDEDRSGVAKFVPSWDNFLIK